jgi:hypothetical protein
MTRPRLRSRARSGRPGHAHTTTSAGTATVRYTTGPHPSWGGVGGGRGIAYIDLAEVSASVPVSSAGGTRRRGRPAGGRLFAATAAAVAIAALAAALVTGAWRIAPAPARAGLELTASVAPTGELAVAPMTPVLRSSRMLPGPGRAVSGSFVVTNQSGRTLTVRFRARATTPALDEDLMLRLRYPGQAAFDAPLAALAKGSSRGLRLASGERRRVGVAAWLRADAGTGHRGLAATVTIEPRATVAAEGAQP